MHICYKGDDLLRASDMLKSGVITWDNLVYAAYEAMQTAYQDDTWEGQAAERFKGYYQDIHGSFAAVYFQLTELFNKKCTAYVAEYLTVDGADHAVIDTDELADVITHIVFRIQGASSVHNAVTTQVSNVSDITGIYYTEPGVVSTLGTMKGKVEKLQQAVWDEESRFVADGFPEMQELLKSLRKLIDGGNAVKVSSDNRSVTYDPSALEETFKDVAAAYENSQDYMDAHETDFAKNDKILQDAIDRRQEELDKRKAAAIGIGIVVGVIGAVVTVATCGAAGPVVAIGIGAAVGAVSSAATSVANQNVGDIYGRGKISIKEVGKEAVIGGITGAITSAVGLGSAKLVASSTKIANPVLRVGAKAGIKAGESVVNGIVNRGIGTSIREEDGIAGLKDAFNLNKMAGDAAGAAASSVMGDAVDGIYKKTGLDKIAKDKKLVDLGTAALKDQVTDGTKRFAGTMAETRDIKQAAEKTFDLEAAGKTLVQTGATKATEYYVADKRNEFDSKRRDQLSDAEKAARDAKKTRMRNMAKNPEFKAQQNVKADREAKDKYAQMYKDGVKSGNVNPEKTQKEHYINRYYKHEADKSKNYSSYYKAARKTDDKTVSKQYESMNKNNAGKIYDATVNWGKGSDYQTPQGEEHNVKQEDIDNLLNYNH